VIKPVKNPHIDTKNLERCKRNLANQFEQHHLKLHFMKIALKFGVSVPKSQS
jgi:hypothetical protein